MQPREQSLPAVNYNTSTPIQYVDIPRDGFGKFLRWTLLATGAIANDGANSGTLVTFPAHPLAMIKRMWLEVNPATASGSKIDIPPHLWHELFFRIFGRAPVRTGFTNGDANQAAVAIEVEGVIPLSIVDSIAEHESLLPLAGRSTLRLYVEWYGSDAATGDALFGTAFDRTLSFTSARIEVELVDFVDASTPKPKFEVVWRHHRHNIKAAGKNKEQLPVPAGEYLRGVLAIQVDNGAPTNAVVTEITLDIGKETKKYWKFGQLQRKNRGDYQIAVASWPTGMWELDLDQKNDLQEPYPIFAQGTTPNLTLDTTGGSAPTAGNSYADCLVESFRLTEYGEQVAREKDIVVPS